MSEEPAAPGAREAIEPSVRVTRPELALFASDMHLDEGNPALTARFLDSLKASLAASLAAAGPEAGLKSRPAGAGPGDAAPALFLLGDLFEYWIGDDAVPPAAQALAGTLAAFSDAGGRVFLMHGNRDFLLDAPLPHQPSVPKYSERCHGRLLADPALIEIGGRRIVLSHGDALCTDDQRYQQWRALCRSAGWQQQFLQRPLAERQAMALKLRQQSMQAQLETETTTDVNRQAAEQLMTRTGTRLLIHGHTHRPRLHRWRPGAQGRTDRDEKDLEDLEDHDHLADGEGIFERWVLSDWGLSPLRGSVVPASAIPPAC